MELERNLLFSIVAVKHELLPLGGISEVASYLKKFPEGDLGKFLVDSGIMAPDDRDFVDRTGEHLVEEQDGGISAILRQIDGDFSVTGTTDKPLASSRLSTVAAESSSLDSELLKLPRSAEERYTVLREHARGGMGRILSGTR